jgi:transporter family-2 protein
MRNGVFFQLALAAGGMITVQSVLNTVLGERISTAGAVLVATVISILILVVVILGFPETANFRELPRPKEWYLYLGGVLGIMILAAPILSIPKIGTAATLTAIVLGQLVLALIIDHFGFLGIPRQSINWGRAMGVVLICLGAYLIKK